MNRLRSILRSHPRLWLAGAIPVVVLLWLLTRLADEPEPPRSLPAEAIVARAPPAGGTVNPAESPEKAASAPSTAEAAAVDSGPVDIFAARSWEPEQPPADEASAEPAEPPEPEAPPLPFRYLGRIDEPGQPTVFFLSHGDSVLVVHEGDLIKGDYRVGKLKGRQLEFLYRPMKIQQFLEVGSPS